MFLEWYYYIFIFMIIGQVVFTIQIYANYHYALKKYNVLRNSYRPPVVIIVPCKGLDSEFEQNLLSFFMQEYKPYRLWLVVQDSADPAYKILSEMIARYSPQTSASEVKLFVSGKTRTCSQKIHNILFCYRQIPEDAEVIVFADSDACADKNWLSHIVHPLNNPKNGASGGYRWFVPKTGDMASYALSSINAVIGQLLGNTPFNHAWGGSMAIKVDTFRSLKIEDVWSKAICDDLTLSGAVRKAGKKMVFVPACMVASYETTVWPKLFEFVRRQFVITRIYAPVTWLFGFFGLLFSVGGLWTVLAVGIASHYCCSSVQWPAFATALLIYMFQLMRAVFRQKMILVLLKKDQCYLKKTKLADICLFWLWGIILLFLIISSSFGNTICWRGIRYRLNSPTNIVVLQND